MPEGNIRNRVIYRASRVEFCMAHPPSNFNVVYLLACKSIYIQAAL